MVSFLTTALPPRYALPLALALVVLAPFRKGGGESRSDERGICGG